MLVSLVRLVTRILCYLSFRVVAGLKVYHRCNYLVIINMLLWCFYSLLTILYLSECVCIPYVLILYGGMLGYYWS
jgi:hypothetical protein